MQTGFNQQFFHYNPNIKKINADIFSMVTWNEFLSKALLQQFFWTVECHSVWGSRSSLNSANLTWN